MTSSPVVLLSVMSAQRTVGRRGSAGVRVGGVNPHGQLQPERGAVFNRTELGGSLPGWERDEGGCCLDLILLPGCGLQCYLLPLSPNLNTLQGQITGLLSLRPGESLDPGEMLKITVAWKFVSHPTLCQ